MAALLAASRVLGADASPVPAKPCCQEKPAAAAASRGIAAGGCVQPPVGKKEACCQDKSAQKKDACCQDKPAEKKEPCCEELTAAPFTKNSLYQADVAFTDDAGKALKLGALRGRPVVLTMFFASCGYACPLLVSDMEAIRAKLPAELRDRAALVLVSFDTVRDPDGLFVECKTRTIYSDVIDSSKNIVQWFDAGTGRRVKPREDWEFRRADGRPLDGDDKKADNATIATIGPDRKSVV